MLRTIGMPTNSSIPHFTFAPPSAPHPELVATYGADGPQLVVIDRLRQLTEALSTGAIGFEWWTELTRRELILVGW